MDDLFDQKLNKLIRLGKERQIKFVGLGCIPINKKTEDVDFEVWDLLNELFDMEEDFLDYWRKVVMGLDHNPTLGDGIPEDARFPATDGGI